MSSSSSSDAAAALKLEIARLTGAISQAKTSSHPRSSKPTYGNPTFKNKYVNPSYKAPTRPASTPITAKALAQPRPPAPIITSTARKDVTIGGVDFVSSGRSLVRKDLAPPAASVRPPRPAGTFPRRNFDSTPAHRPYKAKTSSRSHPARAGNMTLNNTRRPYSSGKSAQKRVKYTDKPCPRFTTTGSCNRGLTCAYQHDPAKIAICWKFLQGNCSKTADTCELSHDPTPERTPLCVHFNDRGRCTREKCPFPHVRVGPRAGVCRDFAVLGYCARGIDCEHSHVRECPDFAEKGVCSIKGCKLPHVIRANRTRKPVSDASTTPSSALATADPANPAIDRVLNDIAASTVTDLGSAKTANDAQLGDEFISLTFHESEEDGEEDSEDDEASEEDSSEEDNDEQQ